MFVVVFGCCVVSAPWRVVVVSGGACFLCVCFLVVFVYSGVCLSRLRVLYVFVCFVCLSWLFVCRLVCVFDVALAVASVPFARSRATWCRTTSLR